MINARLKEFFQERPNFELSISNLSDWLIRDLESIKVIWPDFGTITISDSLIIKHKLSQKA